MFNSLTAGGRLPALLRTDPGSPVPIRRAVRFMFAGAAVSVLSLILSIVGAFSLKSDLISSNQASLKSGKVTMSEINSVATAGIVYAIVVGVVAIALWIWMARACQAGRSWARLSATIFFALWSFYTFIQINALQGGMTITVSLLISFVLLIAAWCIGVGAIYNLWRPVSTAFFKARAAELR